MLVRQTGPRLRRTGRAVSVLIQYVARSDVITSQSIVYSFTMKTVPQPL